MLPGKVPPDVLKKYVFTRLGKTHPDLLLGPGVGQDASVIRFGDKVIIVSTDPITGSIEDIGWLAVHVNANDIATFGVAPKWFLNSIMLPPGYTPEDLGRIMSQIDEAAKSLGIAVVGGHTEITEEIEKPIIAGFMLGETSEGEYVTSSGASPGDSIIMTKTIAIEGTSILASEGFDVLSKSLGEDVVNEAKQLRNNISVVREGIVAFQTGHLTAMHDPTEGGLAGGLHEICDASGVGFRIDSDQIPIHPSTQAICDLLKIDSLELISSGCMLMTCGTVLAEDVIKAIEAEGIKAAVIGTITEHESERITTTKGKEMKMSSPKTDALWIALKNLKSL
ncbi:MAG: AIR synthase family protein [Candidatus Thorarchaeota archaeon]